MKSAILSPTTLRTVRLAVKELREILRDRRTIVTLVLMPLFIYPMLGVIVRRVLLTGMETAGTAVFRIVMESDEEAAILRQQLESGSALLPSPSPQNTPGSPLQTLMKSPRRSRPEFEVYPPAPGATPESELLKGYADLAIRIDILDGSPPVCDWFILHRADAAASVQARNHVIECLRALNEQWLRRTLEAHGIDLVLPVRITERSLVSSEQPASPLVTFIPLVLVLMTMTGAVYPAIDLTAGERERGTMEILMAAPVPRRTLLAGKFVAVLTVALLTATVNMVSMFATLFTLGLDRTVLGSSGLRTIPLILLLMVVFAAFFSAVLLSITSVARSFKEAQAWLIPLMLLSLTPGVFSLMPGLEMGPVLTVTPLVNIVLSGRDLLQGHFDLLRFTVVLISTAVYSVSALALAARVFGSDAVLYGSSSSWSSLRHRHGPPRAAAPTESALLTLALVFPLFLVIGSVPTRLTDSLSGVLLLNIGVFLLVFAGVPLIVLKATGTRLPGGLGLNRPIPRTAAAAAICLGLSMWAILYEISVVIGLDAEADNLRRSLETLTEGLRQTPLTLRLAALAIAPAVCEELFFRGFLQTSLRERLKPSAAVVATALLFGLFHIFVRDGLFVERLIPSTIMGILLGWMRERSGTVLPGMLLHVMHNGLLIGLVDFQKTLEQYGIGLAQQTHLPVMTTLACAGLAAAGIAFLAAAHPPNERPRRFLRPDGTDTSS